VKYKDRVRFKPFFKTTFDCNDMPAIEDKSKGWKERFIKSNLPYSFVDDPDLNNPLERQRDAQLLEKLSTDEELSGILNLVIYRAAEIAKTNKIIKRSGKEMFDEYDAQSSSAQTFLDQFCEYDPEMGYKIPSSQIYDAYERWCQYTVSEIVDIGRFGKDLSDMCTGCKRSRSYVKGKKVTIYHGLLFHEKLYDAAISVLKQRLDAGQVVDRSGQVDGQVDMGPQMSNGQAGQANMWNNIVRKFGS
jgi:phage/plasmid-associated DNA primase